MIQTSGRTTQSLPKNNKKKKKYRRKNSAASQRGGLVMKEWDGDMRMSENEMTRDKAKIQTLIYGAFPV